MAQRGFTLIELLVVIAIIALVIAAVPVVFTGAVTGTSLTAAARHMADELRRARSRAIFENGEVGFTVDPASGRYAVLPGGRGGRLPAGSTVRITAPDGDKAATAIVFFPDGSSSGGRLTLARDKRTYDIRVDWLTGRVSIAE